MKGWWAGLGLALTALGASAQEAPARDEVYNARVSRVFDGDTLWVKPLAGGKYRKLRLDGVDAPEICQPGGEASRDAQDDYGRGIARIVHQGEDVAAWMVETGQAWSYRWRRSLGPFAEEEGAAREHRRGLFKDSAPEVPRDFRQRHGPCPMPPRG
jgi:endonuclease YncB( thermonuclease family)